MNLNAAFQSAPAPGPTSGAQSLSIGALELQALAHRHDRDAVPADVSAQQNRVARPARCAGRCVSRCSTTPMPAVLMNIPSPLPLSTTLVSPVTSWTPAACRRRRMDASTALQGLHRQAFFQDERRAQIQRPRAAHRQVVDRAVDRQRADVAAGEEQWPDHIGIGGEGQPRAADARARRRRGGTPAGALPKAGSSSSSSSSCMRRPPPPCASRTCLRSFDAAAGNSRRNSSLLPSAWIPPAATPSMVRMRR